MERSAQSEVLGLAKSSTQPTRSLVNRSYATHYQIMPIGVVAPRTIKRARIALAIGREGGVVFTPRGGGSFCAHVPEPVSLAHRPCGSCKAKFRSRIIL
jgi:hypothetical protein